MNILELKNITKKYPLFTLKNVSFNVKEGSIMGFIGRNGAGKTTTIKGINNLIHLDGGEVKIFQEDFKTASKENRAKIALLINGTDFFPNKRIKDLTDVTKRFYPNWNEETYRRYLKFFELDERKCIKDLSQGMKIKYLLSVALSHDAKLLILDEPTSGLDPISREEILDLFLRLVKTKKVSILFSTHITSDLDKVADEITYIRNGEIILSDNKTNITNSYKKVKGSFDILNNLDETKFISYKKYIDYFEGLINVENINNFENTGVEILNPTIEDVMIYLERSEQNEEFAL